jgi:hypothetical protein
LPDRSTVDRDRVSGPTPTPDPAETEIGPVITDPALDLTSRLAGDAAKDSAISKAAREIYNRARSGETPVGLVRLSEVLTPSMPSAPAPRHPVDDPDAIVEVVRRYPCAGLEATGPDAVARALAAVITDGRRVVVTGTDAQRLQAVREALPTSLRGLCVDGELPLTDAEFRELRWLLVTETAERRSRSNQVLPDPELVPTTERVAQLCRAAGRHGYPARDGADLIPGLLGDLDPARLAVLIDTARRCTSAIGDIDREPSQVAAWGRLLLERVLFGSARPSFERLLDRTGNIVAAADRLSAATDRMGIVGDLPPDAVEQLSAYADYLERGGKARSYFRSQQQRDVEPTLRHLQLDGEPIKDASLLRQVIAFIELIRSMDKLRLLCQRLDVPPPVDVPAAATLNRRLLIVRDAVARTEELRREVLFMHPESPVSMPDLHTTERVAETIARHGGPEHMRRARAEIAELAEGLGRQLDGVASPGVVAPEADDVLDALRELNIADYARALADLAAARRQHHDQHRLLELTSRLREAAPDLAATWQDASAPAFTSGPARFVPLPELLAALPAADTADLVVLLDSNELEARNLLVAASAPRLLAVGTGFGGAGAREYVSGFSPRGDTVVSVLRRAGVPVVLSGEAVAEAVRTTGAATRPSAGARVVSSSGAHAATGGAHALSSRVQLPSRGAHAAPSADETDSPAHADTASPTEPVTTAGVPGIAGPTAEPAGSETAGSHAAGSDTAGSDTAGSDTAGSDTAGSHAAGSHAAGSDTAGSDTAGSTLTGSTTAELATTGSESAGSGRTGPEATDLEAARPEAAAVTRSEGAAPELTKTELTEPEQIKPELTEPESPEPEAEAARPVTPPKAAVGRRPLTEEEAAFMVMPLGIVPRQAERPAIEQTRSEAENLAESESRER